jgi:hypothetical protein
MVQFQLTKVSCCDLRRRRHPPGCGAPYNDAQEALTHPDALVYGLVYKPSCSKSGPFLFRVFGLSMGKKESRRADSNR